MMSNQHASSSDDVEQTNGYVWDQEGCPVDGCDGDLEQQDQFNVMCLTCEEVWTHVKYQSVHRLVNADDETVDEKKRVVADGGENEQPISKATPTGRSARFYEPLESEDDVQAIAQRVAQHCAVALQRGEADFIQVAIQEAESDD